MHIAIALAAVLLAQETPEATFKKIEEGFTKAKTVNVRFVSSLKITRGKDPEQNVEMGGTILMQGENKVCVKVVIKDGDKNIPNNVWCDGETMASDEKSSPAVPGVRVGMTHTLLRLGAAFAAERAPRYARGKDTKEFDAVASNFKAGEKSGDLATLAFDVAFDGGAYKTVLTYDPKTFKVSKVSASHPATDPTSEGKAGVGRWVTETCECVFDGEIADGEFKKPAAK